MGKQLNLKQKAFCHEYLVDFNATQAALRAGYSKKTARQIGYENITKPYIQKHIKELQEKNPIEEITRVTKEQLISELELIAMQNPKNLFDGNSLISIGDLPDNVSKTIAGVKIRIEKNADNEFAEVVDIKAHDKLKAIDMLFRHHGLYEVDNNQSSVKISIHTKEYFEKLHARLRRKNEQ